MKTVLILLFSSICTIINVFGAAHSQTDAQQMQQNILRVVNVLRHDISGRNILSPDSEMRINRAIHELERQIQGTISREELQKVRCKAEAISQLVRLGILAYQHSFQGRYINDLQLYSNVIPQIISDNSHQFQFDPDLASEMNRDIILITSRYVTGEQRMIIEYQSDRGTFFLNREVRAILSLYKSALSWGQFEQNHIEFRCLMPLYRNGR